DIAERAVAEAARMPSLWARIMNPPVDMAPFVLRGQPPLHEPARRDLGPPRSMPDADEQALERAVLAVRAFADRAYRRPVTHEELARFVRFLEACRANGNSHEQAVQLALQAILTAPHFIFRIETGGPGGWLTDLELATRLSYFLWSGPPDDELYRLACLGQLHHEKTLAGQVRRMLRHPRS